MCPTSGNTSGRCKLDIGCAVMGVIVINPNFVECKAGGSESLCWSILEIGSVWSGNVLQVVCSIEVSYLWDLPTPYTLDPYLWETLSGFQRVWVRVGSWIPTDYLCVLLYFYRTQKDWLCILLHYNRISHTLILIYLNHNLSVC